MSQAAAIPLAATRADMGNRRRRLVLHYLAQTLLWFFIVAGLVCMVFPAAWMILSSFKSLAEVQSIPMTILPTQWHWENYEQAWRVTRMARSFVNSTILAVTVTVVILLTSTWGGYVFSKLDWPGRDKMLLVLLSTMMIPGFLTLIPRFVMVIKMGFVNSYAGIIVPGMVSTFGIFMCRQFMLGIPRDLTDAGIVDGCNAFQIYWQIILPLCTPVMAVLAIFTFDGSWNSLLWPLMVLTNRDLWTIPVTLAGLRTQEMFQYHIQMAGASIAIIPVIIVFLLLQKYIIQGVQTTGLKG